MRLGVFGVFLAPFGALGLMCDPPIDASASRAASRTGNNDSSISANWLAADSSDAAITGTNPHAIASITLTDSMSAIEQCTNKSPERNKSGISACLWNPISALRASKRRRGT